MNTAIFSDVHGNLPAFEKVLQDIDRRGAERVICLGDLVEGGEQNEEVIEIIRDQGYPTVMGNHDEINDCALTPTDQAWLSALPENIIEEDVVYTHISPRTKRTSSISDKVMAWNVFDEEVFRLCFIGHTHSPYLFGDKNNEFGEAKSYAIDEGVFTLDNDDRYIISFGAVGYPREGGKFIRYGLHDSVNNTIEFIKLDGPLLPYGSNAY